MATQEQCSRYAEHIRTSTGQTVDDPVGWVATWYDVKEWRTVATDFVDTVQGNAANLASPGELGQRAAMLRTRLDDGPGWFAVSVPPTVSYSDAAAYYWKLAQEAACLLAEVEDQLHQDGAAPAHPYALPVPANGGGSPQGKGTGKATGKGMGLGFVVALGLLAWYQGSKGGDQ